MDGIGCAILGRLAFKNIDIEYCNYDDVNKKIRSFFFSDAVFEYDKIFITDISIDSELAHDINVCASGSGCFPEIRLIDHHPTASWLNKYDWATVEEETVLLHCMPESGIVEKVSGTYLFFMYLLSEDHIIPTKEEYTILKEFADIVRKYDTWLWKETYNDETPKKLNDLFYILGRDKFIEDILYKIKSNDLNFNYTDNLLLELEQKKIDKYVEDKYKNIIITNIQNYAVGVVFAEQYHSELGNRLSEKHQGLDFIIIINMSKSISYRTIKDYIHLGNDIAKFYGGGGHAKAAGSPIGDNIREELIKMLLK